MKKESIVQFICFATKLEPEDFSPLWKEFAKSTKADSINLYEVKKKEKNRFRYISRLSSKSTDFRFAFMKERNSDHFPEQTAKVIQLGGYSAVQLQAAKKKKSNEVKVMAFMEENTIDLDFCKKQEYSTLDIYEAYYENCKYSYIMEFVLPDSEVELLVGNLNAHGGIDVMNQINPLVNASY
ncbi:MAG: hypothetical protein IPQ08_12590 [Chitinophagaceae bacterium]|nr:hypothetical protein [Chitinophagaceae bacterium]